jgi:hypothetical protein
MPGKQHISEDPNAQSDREECCESPALRRSLQRKHGDAENAAEYPDALGHKKHFGSFGADVALQTGSRVKVLRSGGVILKMIGVLVE